MICKDLFALLSILYLILLATIIKKSSAMAWIVTSISNYIRSAELHTTGIRSSIFVLSLAYNKYRTCCKHLAGLNPFYFVWNLFSSKNSLLDGKNYLSNCFPNSYSANGQRPFNIETYTYVLSSLFLIIYIISSIFIIAWNVDFLEYIQTGYCTYCHC